MKMLSICSAILLYLSSSVYSLYFTPTIQPPNGPDDFYPLRDNIGVYGDNKQRKAELWQHNRLPFYKAVLRCPYEEFYLEEDGGILFHNDYNSWGNYYPKEKD
jgi:hypothetical protein